MLRQFSLYVVTAYVVFGGLPCFCLQVLPPLESEDWAGICQALRQRGLLSQPRRKYMSSDDYMSYLVETDEYDVRPIPSFGDRV